MASGIILVHPLCLSLKIDMVQQIVMTEGNLTDIALDPTSILQIGFVNPAQYYFEFYLNTE